MKRIHWWQPTVVLGLVVAFWYAIAAWYDRGKELAFVVPYPHLVFQEAVTDGMFREQLLENLFQTVVVTATGLVIAAAIGMTWAVLMSQARWLEHSLYPYAVILQTIPILAIVP